MFLYKGRMALFLVWDSLCIETVCLSAVSSFYFAKCCRVDVQVKRGSAQQDKGPLVALLALSWFRVLV